MKKYLLLGSAGYVKEWYAQNGQKYLEDGYILCAMNNAWAIDPKNLMVWFHSTDFYELGNTVKPSGEEREQWIEITKYTETPFFYKAQQGGTMILNVLCHLLNQSHHNKIPLWIAIAGADLVYKHIPADHFYGHGTADPLRLKADFLVEQLLAVKIKAEALKCTICNVGGQDETLLPFVRYAI